jgi:hypothetical protein
LHEIISYFLELSQFARTEVTDGWRIMDPATCYFFFIISHFLKLNQHINVGGRARDYALFVWLINHG